MGGGIASCAVAIFAGVMQIISSSVSNDRKRGVYGVGGLYD